MRKRRRAPSKVALGSSVVEKAIISACRITGGTTSLCDKGPIVFEYRCKRGFVVVHIAWEGAISGLVQHSLMCQANIVSSHTWRIRNPPIGTIPSSSPPPPYYFRLLSQAEHFSPDADIGSCPRWLPPAFSQRLTRLSSAFLFDQRVRLDICLLWTCMVLARLLIIICVVSSHRLAAHQQSAASSTHVDSREPYKLNTTILPLPGTTGTRPIACPR